MRVLTVRDTVCENRQFLSQRHDLSAILRSIIIHYVHSSLYSIFSFIAIIAPAPAAFNQFQQINIFNSIYLNFKRITATWFLFRAMHGETADSFLFCISIAIFFFYLCFIWSPVFSWDVHNVVVVHVSHTLLYSISFSLRDSSWSPHTILVPMWPIEMTKTKL